MKYVQRVGLLTSGGDAPGMNAAIRAIVLALGNDVEVIGYRHGYNGLINSESVKLEKIHVDNIIHLGGTIIKSARCKEMLEEQGVSQAVTTLIKDKIDALIVIGGDGSFTGLMAIEKQWDGLVIGLPGTIDNDLDGTDNTIGFLSAVNTAIDAIDKIRDTADAFDRVFIIELMGRHSGHIAFNVGLASGAEAILSFENTDTTQHEQVVSLLAKQIREHQVSCQNSFLICVAENLWPTGISGLKAALNQYQHIDASTCILGHIQRGARHVQPIGYWQLN
ncbi:6-phosphofructokinase [Thalassotalea sp. LPB0316]|uniref:6-phosphofructokinase n=1 Tax=Thalassotalea sp. LPB0316 TaxID=2769490 RepID=UPI001D040B3C|nr:6-phosphofructokinase [Thalassotalea sp. LPB0316]